MVTRELSIKTNVRSSESNPNSIVKRSLDFNLEEARQFRQDLSNLKEKKEINLYYKQCGGQIYVQDRLRLLDWWEALSQDLTDKIVGFPFKVFRINDWFELTQLSIDQVEEWSEKILSTLEERGTLFAKDILDIAKPLFSPKPIKSLKLGEEVSEEGLSLVQEKFQLDDEQLAHLKTKLEPTEGKTEILLALLDDLKLDSLKLLTPKGQLTWQKVQYEAKLDNKDAQLAQAQATVNDSIAAHKQSQDLVKEQAEIISRQEKAIEEQLEQIKQLLELSQTNKKKSKSSFFSNVEKATPIQAKNYSKETQYANIN